MLRRRSWRSAIAVGAVPLAAVGLGARRRSSPNSLVRYDPETLEPTDVIKVGAAPDLVVAAGDYVWVTHYVIGTE